jgi:hypothetical protein
VLAAPTGDSARARILALTDSGLPTSTAAAIALDPAEAAARILAALTEWGYLDSTT